MTDEELTTLRYWLANEDVYMSSYVRGWLERTPPAEAADVLAGVSESAQPEPHSLWWTIFRGLILTFATSEGVSKNSPAARKVGTRAALLLARMDDPRAIPPLVRVFEAEPGRAGKYQGEVERELTRLLSHPIPGPLSREQAEAVEELAERIWSSGRGRRDLSSERADMLIAALSRLSETGAEAERAILHAIATSESGSPNRTRVATAARKLTEKDGRDPVLTNPPDNSF
jgi:hypothetical protein